MSTINLPVKSVKYIVDVDNRNVVIPVEKGIETLAELAAKDSDKPTGLRTLFAAPESHGSTTNFNYEYCFINKILKRKITKINPDVKYWEITFKYYTDRSITFLVPGFVKFYSLNNQTFVPVEFMKKSDLLVDTQGRMVQVVKKVEMTGEEALKLNEDEYYSFYMNSSSDNYFCQFYFNEILALVSYNNYGDLV